MNNQMGMGMNNQMGMGMNNNMMGMNNQMGMGMNNGMSNSMDNMQMNNQMMNQMGMMPGMNMMNPQMLNSMGPMGMNQMMMNQMGMGMMPMMGMQKMPLTEEQKRILREQGYKIGKQMAEAQKKANAAKNPAPAPAVPEGPATGELTIKFKKGGSVTTIKMDAESMVAELINEYFTKTSTQSGTFKFGGNTLAPTDTSTLAEAGLKNNSEITVS